MPLKGETVILQRDDIRPGRVQAMAIEYLQLEYFRDYLFKLIEEADIVIFVDKDKTTRILKNTYSMTGMVTPVPV